MRGGRERSSTGADGGRPAWPPVGCHAANAWGLHDGIGNVWRRPRRVAHAAAGSGADEWIHHPRRFVGCLTMQEARDQLQ